MKINTIAKEQRMNRIKALVSIALLMPLMTFASDTGEKQRSDYSKMSETDKAQKRAELVAKDKGLREELARTEEEIAAAKNALQNLEVQEQIRLYELGMLEGYLADIEAKKKQETKK